MARNKLTKSQVQWLVLAEVTVNGAVVVFLFPIVIPDSSTRTLLSAAVFLYTLVSVFILLKMAR